MPDTEKSKGLAPLRDELRKIRKRVWGGRIGNDKALNLIRAADAEIRAVAVELKLRKEYPGHYDGNDIFPSP